MPDGLTDFERRMLYGDSPKAQRDKLLKGIEEHRATFDDAPTADQRLYDLAASIQQRGGGDASARTAERRTRPASTRVTSPGTDDASGPGAETSELEQVIEGLGGIEGRAIRLAEQLRRLPIQPPEDQRLRELLKETEAREEAAAQLRDAARSVKDTLGAVVHNEAFVTLRGTVNRIRSLLPETKEAK